MKKIIIAVTSLMLVLGLTSCSSTKDVTDIKSLSEYLGVEFTETNPEAIKIKEDVLEYVWDEFVSDLSMEEILDTPEEIWGVYEQAALLEVTYCPMPADGYTSVDDYINDVIYYRDEVISDYNYFTEGDSQSGKWIVDDYTWVCNDILEGYYSGEDAYFIGDNGEVLSIIVNSYYKYYCNNPESLDEVKDAEFLYKCRMYEKHVLGINNFIPDENANQNYDDAPVYEMTDYYVMISGEEPIRSIPLSDTWSSVDAIFMFLSVYGGISREDMQAVCEANGYRDDWDASSEELWDTHLFLIDYYNMTGWDCLEATNYYWCATQE